MIRRLLQATLTIALLVVVGWVAKLTADERSTARRLARPTGPWPPVPLDPVAPAPTTGRAATPVPPAPAWVEPVDGGCPGSHPVKVKLRSGLYHLPGMAAYERTGPDRCYATPEAAEADGFTRAKR